MLPIAHFWSMRRPVRSLLYLFWISGFVSGAVTVSTQIYIYQVFNSVEVNIVAGIAMFTGCMIGFCVYGAIGLERGPLGWWRTHLTRLRRFNRS
jgi:hypothetical protein